MNEWCGSPTQVKSHNSKDLGEMQNAKIVYKLLHTLSFDDLNNVLEIVNKELKNSHEYEVHVLNTQTELSHNVRSSIDHTRIKAQ